MIVRSSDAVYHAPDNYLAEDITRSGVVGTIFTDEFGRLVLAPSPKAKRVDLVRLENLDRLMERARLNARKKRLGNWIDAATADDLLEDVL